MYKASATPVFTKPCICYEDLFSLITDFSHFHLSLGSSRTCQVKATCFRGKRLTWSCSPQPYIQMFSLIILGKDLTKDSKQEKNE